jgi:hypothetical protein
MTNDKNKKLKKLSRLNLLRKINYVVIPIGALVSLYFTFKAGGNNKSFLLLSMFMGWVAFPFLGLFFFNFLCKSFLPPVRLTLIILTYFITIGSLICYSGLVKSRHVAFLFLVVPFVSWVLLLVIIPLAASRARILLNKS